MLPFHQNRYTRHEVIAPRAVGPVRQDKRHLIMTNPTTRFDDRRMDIIMGRLLQAGVLLASTIVLIGGILYLRAHAHDPANYRTFPAHSATLYSPIHLFHLLTAGDPAAIIQLGILLLIATPVARVLFAIIGFTIERDRLYILISLIVFTVLMIGIFH
jgi:uncharacterized membrane protein